MITCDCADAETPEEYVMTITDFSRHGVFVNGERITPGTPAPLAHDDVVVFPFSMEYRFEVLQDAPRPVPPPSSGTCKKTPGSKKKSVGKPGGAKRAAQAGDDNAAKRVKASEKAAEDGGERLSFDEEGGASGSGDKGKGKSVELGPLKQTDGNVTIEAAKRFETANVELRETLERVEKERDELTSALAVANEDLDKEKKLHSETLQGVTESATQAVKSAEQRVTAAEAATAKATDELEAAVCGRNECDAALDRANKAREEAEAQKEAAEKALGRETRGWAEKTAALESENTTHRAELDEARAAASAATIEYREVCEELEQSKETINALTEEKKRLTRELELAVERADKADHCAAPLRAEAAEAMARCKKGEDAANAMSDRMNVARVAWSTAMNALHEVGARLGGDSDDSTRTVVAASPSVAIDPTLPGDVPAIKEKECLETEPETERNAIGMDIMYATEPPSEMPFDGEQSDPVPETEQTRTEAGVETEPMPPPPNRAVDENCEGDEPNKAVEEHAHTTTTPDKVGADTQEAATVLGVEMGEHRGDGQGNRRLSHVSAVVGGLVDDLVAEGMVNGAVKAIDEEVEEEEEDEQAEDEGSDDDVQVVENPKPVSPSDKENTRTVSRKNSEKKYNQIATESEIGDPVPMSFLSS